MTHHDADPLLGALAAGLLPPDVAEEVWTHTDDCTPCRQGLAHHLALWLHDPPAQDLARLGELPDEEPVPALDRRVVLALVAAALLLWLVLGRGGGPTAVDGQRDIVPMGPDGPTPEVQLTELRLRLSQVVDGRRTFLGDTLPAGARLQAWSPRGRLYLRADGFAEPLVDDGEWWTWPEPLAGPVHVVAVDPGDNPFQGAWLAEPDWEARLSEAGIAWVARPLSPAAP